MQEKVACPERLQPPAFGFVAARAILSNHGRRIVRGRLRVLEPPMLSKGLACRIKPGLARGCKTATPRQGNTLVEVNVSRKMRGREFTF